MPTYLTSKSFTAGDYLTFTELNAAIGNNGNMHWLKEALKSIGVSADSGTQTIESGLVGCRVFGGSQQISDSKWTDVAWSDQRWGRWNGANMEFLLSGYPSFVHLPIVPADAMQGYFLTGAHVAWAGNTTGSRGLRIVIRTNRTNVDLYTVIASKVKEATAAGAVMTMSIQTLDTQSMTGGSSYSVQVWQDSGDTLELTTIPGTSPECWVVKVASSVAI